MKFGIFIYDDVEPIDLATYGVLSMARRIEPSIEICTIAPLAGEVRLANGLRVLADHGIDDAPQLQYLIVAGGPGWVVQAESQPTLDFIRSFHGKAKVASVCTGAMILAASGILDGQHATTKREVVPPEISPLQLMRERHPAIHAHEASLVEGGAIITGGGVSLCIDATLHIIARAFGVETARETARIMEYQRAWEANRLGFPSYVADRP